MMPLVATKYNKVRRGLGLRVAYQSRRTDCLRRLQRRKSIRFCRPARPLAVAAFGVGGIAIILWLMMFKPFQREGLEAVSPLERVDKEAVAFENGDRLRC